MLASLARGLIMLLIIIAGLGYEYFARSINSEWCEKGVGFRKKLWITLIFPVIVLAVAGIGFTMLQSQINGTPPKPTGEVFNVINHTNYVLSTTKFIY